MNLQKQQRHDAAENMKKNPRPNTKNFEHGKIIQLMHPTIDTNGFYRIRTNYVKTEYWRALFRRYSDH
jgi:hypothetical protein